MLLWLTQDAGTLFREYPQILIFLSLALGYYIGKIKIFGFNLGATASVLLAAIILGQFNVQIHPLLQTVAFALFIFTIGYKVGPQFFGGLKKGTLSYVILAIFVAFTGLITAIILGKLLAFSSGTTAGLLAGAMTQSSVIGTATDAIKGLAISSAQKSSLTSDIAIAYAITYIFGVAGLILFYKIVPKLLKIDLKKEATQLGKKFAGLTKERSSENSYSFNSYAAIRTYKVTHPALLGKTFSDLHNLLQMKNIIIEKLKRGMSVITPNPEMIVQEKDVIMVVGSRESMIKATDMIGPEIDDQSLIELPTETVKIWVTNDCAQGKTLALLQRSYCPHCYITKISRQSNELPMHENTIVSKGDVLHVIGLEKSIQIFAKKLGYIEKKTNITNIAMIGLGCFLGTLVGLIGFHTSNLTIGNIAKELSRPINNIILLIILGGALFGYIRHKKLSLKKALQKKLLPIVGSIFLGILISVLFRLNIFTLGKGGIAIGIGAGILLSGLCFGWLKSLYPQMGGIPESAQWILTDLGLNLFIACVGLSAAPRAFHALKTNGLTLLFAGMILTLVPHIVGLIFGRLVLKLNYVLLFGALTGAGTATPSLNVLKNECDSLTPALGYTVPYAIGNFILTIWGMVIVSLM